MARRSTKMVDLKDSDSWRPWRAKDMQSLMYLNIACTSIVGLFPFKYNSQTYAFSKTRFAVSTISVFAYAVFVAYEIYLFNGVNRFLSPLKYIYVELYLFVTVMLIFTIYAATYSRLIVLQKMLKLTRMLSRKDFNDLAKFVHTKDIIDILYHVAFISHGAFELSVLGLHRTAFSYISGAAIVGEMFYVHCVRLLGACFQKVNENLKQLNEPLMNQRPLYFRAKSPSYRQNTLLWMEVKHYEELHDEIADTVEVLNNAFREQIIISIAATFTTVTFNLYFSMQWISKDDVPGMSDFRSRLVSLVYTIYMGMKFVMLIYACETATSQAMEITTTIHEVAGKCTDTTVRRELGYFARQVQHRDVAFSVKAFTVNAKLLSQLVGAVSMYTMILFQFMIGAACSGQQSP